MQSDRLERLLRSKGSSYIPSQNSSPFVRSSLANTVQTNKYITNYAIQKSSNPPTDRRNMNSIPVIPRAPTHVPSVSPIRVVIPSTERSQSIIVSSTERQKPVELHEIHHYERPLQVVTMEDMEKKYKFKLQQYEQTVYQLQVENQRLKLHGYIEQSVPQNNDLEIVNQNLKNSEDKLKIEVKQLKEELLMWKDRYSQQQKQNVHSNNDEELRQLKRKLQELSQDNQEISKQIGVKDQEILRLRGILNEKDDIIDQLNEHISELQVIQENYSRVETTVISLQGEVDVWRKKFKEKNEEASELSEKLIMAETSLEAMKKRQITTVKEVNVTKSNNKIPTTMTQSIDIAGRLSANNNRGSHYSGRQQL